MFKNLYDGDVIVFTPDGKLLQNEYAKNASLNGKLVFAIRSLFHIVISSYNENFDYKSKTANKLIAIDENSLIGISGIIGDGRILSELLNAKKKEYELGNNTTVKCSQLSSYLSEVFHINTIYSGSRPFGVNALIAGYDKMSANIFQIIQDGYSKVSIGAGIGLDAEKSKNTVDFFKNQIIFSSINELIQLIVLSLKKKILC